MKANNTQRRTIIARGQKSGGRIQRSEVRSQKSGGRDQAPLSVVRPLPVSCHAPRFTLHSPGRSASAEPGALRAFTLVELLVVISIIAILLGIILPSYFSIREKAKYTKAKVTVKNLETAFKAYLDHYRVWPALINFDGAAHDIDETVVKILRGDPDPINNKDGIAFYEFESTNSTYGALDAWSNPYDPPATWKPYRFQVDHDYNNQITTAGGILYRTVIVWSVGTNRTDDISAPATKEGNVKSWD